MRRVLGLLILCAGGGLAAPQRPAVLENGRIQVAFTNRSLASINDLWRNVQLLVRSDEFSVSTDDRQLRSDSLKAAAVQRSGRAAELVLPSLTPGQFQGVFFENVRNHGSYRGIPPQSGPNGP